VTTKEQNTQYWNKRAAGAHDPVTATHRDRFQRHLELEQVIANWPEHKPRELDVGCGMGWTSDSIASRSLEVVAIDRSPEMISGAKAAFRESSNVRYEVGDVLSLPEDWNASFDLVLSQRCLINLSGWEEQQIALDEIARVLKPGGRLILQEGTKQGREELNELRSRVGLPRMPEVIYNRDFDEDVLWPYLRSHFRVISEWRFSLYDLISRVVHPLLVVPEEPKYDSPINEIAALLASTESGVQASRRIAREFSAVLERQP
jgi:ubiquinone/menaquinone biosynthesis C-methylase UbiE